MDSKFAGTDVDKLSSPRSSLSVKRQSRTRGNRKHRFSGVLRRRHVFGTLVNDANIFSW